MKIEDRQFGPSLRALAFVQTRKSGLTISGFYMARKKYEVPPSQTDVDISAGQASMNLKERGSDGGRNYEARHEASQPSNPNMVRNACPSVINLTEVQRDSTKDDTNGFNAAFKSGVMSQTITDIDPKAFEFHSNTIIASITSQSVGHTKLQDFNAKLREIDTALAKFDNGKETELSFNNESAHATNLDSLQSNSSEARDPIRAALSTATLRVLPTWTRKNRVATCSQRLGNEHLSSRKRELTEKELSSDFPSKRHKSIHNAKGDYLEVVEAVEQPRQAQ